MIHKGLMVFGSTVAVVPFLGSAGYFIIPPLMKTLPKHISQVKSGGECFTALSGKGGVEGVVQVKDAKEQVVPKDSYLLVCRASTNDLNFYYYALNGSKLAIPVKAINVSGEKNERDVTIKFFWKSNLTLQLQQPLESVQWIKKDEKDYELKDFCNRTEIKSFSGYDTKALMCYRKLEDGRESQETWLNFTNWEI